jgi:hypothetical protein
MRKLSVVFIVAAAVLGVMDRASAQLRVRAIDQICPRALAVESESGTIYKNSAPLRTGGIGTPIVSFRQEPTLIFNRRNFMGGTHTIYDSNGTSLGRCPVVSAHGHAGRARCTMNTGGLRRTAIKNTRSPMIYFKINRNLCVRVPDAGKCYGSVKGLCDRTLG